MLELTSPPLVQRWLTRQMSSAPSEGFRNNEGAALTLDSVLHRLGFPRSGLRNILAQGSQNSRSEGSQEAGSAAALSSDPSSTRGGDSSGREDAQTPHTEAGVLEAEQPVSSGGLRYWF